MTERTPPSREFAVEPPSDVDATVAATAMAPDFPAEDETGTAGPDRGVTPGWKTDFRLQLVIAGLATLAVNATRPIVTYQALALGASTVEIGLVQSAFSIIPAFTAVAVGRLVDRGSEAKYLAIALLLFSLGTLAAANSATLLILAAAQVFTGMGHILNLVAGQAMIANRGPREGRDGRFGSYSVAASLGQLSGPVIAGLIAGSATVGAVGAGVALGGYSLEDGQRVFLAAGTATFIGAMLATVIFVRNRERDARLAEARPSEASEPMLSAAMRVLRRSGMPAAMAVSIIVISVVDVLIAYLPVYGQEAGLAVAIVGFLLSVRAGASLVSRIFMGRTIARLGRERTLAVSMTMAGIGIGSIPFTDSVPLLAILMAVSGFGLGVCQPMTIAWVAQRSPRAERATAIGVRLTGNRTALMIVPTAMGAIAGTAGIMALFWVMGLALLGGALLAARTPFDELRDQRDAPTAA